MITLLTSDHIIQHWDSIKGLLRYCREVGSNAKLPDEYYVDKLNDLIGYLKNDKAYFFAAQEDGIVVGFLWACEIERDIGRVFHVLYFAVLEEYQGKGYGKLLLEAAQRKACEKEIKKMELNVHISNSNAIDFYRKNSFYDDHITMRRDL